jgi:eukaryotic-like serine/threonine-protein kinase
MSAPDPALSATVDALARTLAPSAAQLGALATIRPALPAAPPLAARPQHGTLPRLDVSVHEPGKPSPPAAELELTTILGRGGMGAVWLAKQRSIGREVAVKRLAGEAWSVSDAAALLVEARATGALEHPSIVPVHALGVASDGSPLLVMKRIEGTTLDALLRDPSHASWPALEKRHGDRLLAQLEILARVADALELAHARGFVHRDVKPENIMVGAFGETYLLDWGIALAPRGLTPEEREQVSIVGTPAFMAPEMALGRVSAIDARTDVYLLGATLHAILTGEPRHGGETLHAVLLSALLSLPVEYGPDVPAELAALARRATAVDPEDRVPSVQAFREALAEFRRHSGSMTLTREVEAKLAAIPASPGDDALVSPALSRTLTEARFGLLHALSQWPDNELARAALARTLRLLVLVELARGSHETATALLADMDAPDPALALRVAALRDQRDAQGALADRARADAVDRDPGVSGHARALFAIGITVLSVGTGVAWYLATGATGDAVLSVIAGDVVQMVLVACVIAIFRRRLLANRWSRRALGLMFMGGALLVLANAAAALRGETEADFSIRNLVFAAIFAVAAPDLTPRLWVAAAWALVATLVTAASPAHGALMTTGSLLLGIGALIWESMRPSRRAPER